MKNMQQSFFNYKALENWGTHLFQRAGVPKVDAEILVKALVKTSLWGIDSHGIARIPHYLNRFDKGSIKKNPDIAFTKTGFATGYVNGDDGHGILIMNNATENALFLANDSGAGVVGIKNSSHCGAIGLYTRRLTENGMVGIAFTHSDALVVPHEGKKAFLGTNPISIAFPTEDIEQPICVDMATSIVPWNYIMNSRRENATVPVGLGVDIQGNNSIDPSEIVAVKPMADHKGYALSFLIDMLCGPLNGMAFGPNITPMYDDLEKRRGLGSLIIAIDPNRYGGLEYVRNAGMAMINQVREQGSQIRYPGEPEYIMMKERREHGIPISNSLALEYQSWSEKLGVKYPFPI
jgi:ureidoglycolate dehydrogenase (NAD+)